MIAETSVLQEVCSVATMICLIGWMCFAAWIMWRQYRDSQESQRDMRRRLDENDRLFKERIRKEPWQE